MTRLLLTAAAALASTASLTGAAQAQPSLTAAVFAGPPPKISIAPQIARAHALRQAGVARTSVDHSFDGKATASLGLPLRPAAPR